MATFFYLLLAGIVGGFIAGLVGIGGGVVYIFVLPAALSHLGVPFQELAQFTIANSVFAILFASSSANYILLRIKFFYLKEVLTISGFAVVSSILALRYIVNNRWYSFEVFNLILVILISFMLYTTLRTAREVSVAPLSCLNSWKLAIVGIAGGTISALSGMGGGIVIIPILNSLLKIDIKKSSSISSGVIMVTAFMMTVYNMSETSVFKYAGLQLGYIIFSLSLILALGVIISSPFGVKVSRKLSSVTISYIYATFLLLVVLRKVVEIFNYYI